jgi:hypothetical protein
MKLLRACLVIFLCTSFALEIANLIVALSLLTVLFPRMIPSAVAQWLCLPANAFVRAWLLFPKMIPLAVTQWQWDG